MDRTVSRNTSHHEGENLAQLLRYPSSYDHANNLLSTDMYYLPLGKAEQMCQAGPPTTLRMVRGTFNTKFNNTLQPVSLKSKKIFM